MFILLFPDSPSPPETQKGEEGSGSLGCQVTGPSC